MQPWNFKKMYHIKGKVAYSSMYELFYINIDNLYKLIPTNIDKFPEFKYEDKCIDIWGKIQGTFNPYITTDTRFVWGSLVELCDHSSCHQKLEHIDCSSVDDSNESKCISSTNSSVDDSNESKCISSTVESYDPCDNVYNIMDNKYTKIYCTLNDIIQKIN